jgi:hypothetical protein
MSAAGPSSAVHSPAPTHMPLAASTSASTHVPQFPWRHIPPTAVPAPAAPPKTLTHTEARAYRYNYLKAKRQREPTTAAAPTNNQGRAMLLQTSIKSALRHALSHLWQSCTHGGRTVLLQQRAAEKPRDPFTKRFRSK